MLGADTVIEIHAYDETNTRIRPDRIARMIEQADDGMAMLVGVQSNQFPRAMDLARDSKLCLTVQMALVPSTWKSIDRTLDYLNDPEANDKAEQWKAMEISCDACRDPSCVGICR